MRSACLMMNSEGQPLCPASELGWVYVFVWSSHPNERQRSCILVARLLSSLEKGSVPGSQAEAQSLTSYGGFHLHSLEAALPGSCLVRTPNPVPLWKNT